MSPGYLLTCSCHCSFSPKREFCVCTTAASSYPITRISFTPDLLPFFFLSFLFFFSPFFPFRLLILSPHLSDCSQIPWSCEACKPLEIRSHTQEQQPKMSLGPGLKAPTDSNATINFSWGKDNLPKQLFINNEVSCASYFALS
jgi:hypothetical protein